MACTYVPRESHQLCLMNAQMPGTAGKGLPVLYGETRWIVRTPRGGMSFRVATKSGFISLSILKGSMVIGFVE